MTKAHTYPFYSSLRFRFGMLFGFIFLLFISVIVFVLYSQVLQSLRDSFHSRLQSSAYIVLQKTEVNPLIVPLPQKGEYFRLLYNYANHTDTLYSNLPLSFTFQNNDAWQYVHSSRTLETGGAITIHYVLPAVELSRSVHRLQTMLIICIPLAFILSLFTGYFLSGFLLRPINAITSKANDIDLQSHIDLLEKPATKDELHRLTVVLNRMLQRISRQAQQQNAFFASASHELRTPLSNMLTQLQVQKKENHTETEQLAIESQIQDVQRLSKIVNDFLLMSQLKAGSLPIKKANVDVADTCLLCMEKLQEKANEKGQKFKLQAKPESETFIIRIDESHLQTVLNNLLMNAVKYGKSHSVVTLLITKEEETVTVEISNAINTDFVCVEKIAREFSRNASQPQEGFGLGLWLSKQLLEKNGGELLLSSADAIFKAVIGLRES